MMRILLPEIKKISQYLISLSVIVLFLTNCKKEDNNVPKKLKLLASYQINIPELSGLSKFNGDDKFITVSDFQNRVYIISKTGNLLKTLEYKGDDLEGVVFDTITKSIFVVEEKKKEIVQLDSNGYEINRLPININNSATKHGPEGITYNPENKHFYIVNEKMPAVLLEINREGEIVNENYLSFASDYSSVYYDNTDSTLWILSDESKTITNCNLFGNTINSWSTGIDKGEGLIVDKDNSKIYIISDSDSYLYVFSFPEI